MAEGNGSGGAVLPANEGLPEAGAVRVDEPDTPRSPVSVPANVAEGQGRHHTREFLNHLSIARGSLMELETHLQLSRRIGLLTDEALPDLLGAIDEISRMLSGLRTSLSKRL